MSLAFLARTFSLDRRTVNSIVSRMIWTEELPASLDQSAGVIVFHRVELTRPQQLAQILAEKVGALVEQNEKALDIRLGGSTAWGDRTDALKGDKRGEQAQERRGRGERRGMSARGKLCVHNVAFITKILACTIQVQGLAVEHGLHKALGVRHDKYVLGHLITFTIP
jgi:hypothetical protein